MNVNIRSEAFFCEYERSPARLSFTDMNIESCLFFGGGVNLELQSIRICNVYNFNAAIH
jgi:hypothetical protein